MDYIPIKQFVREQRITLRAERTDHNPNIDDAEYIRIAKPDHWKVTLRRRDPETGKRTQMTLVFTMGCGHGGRKPVTEEVLECLALDAAGIENARGFSDWCAEYDYGEHPRAHRIYLSTFRQTQRFKRFMGSAYETMLWKVDSSEF